MANNEHWYAVKVRAGFEIVVTQRLRNLNLDVFVLERKSIPSQEPDQKENQDAGCIYCCFDLHVRNLITSIPGVLDVLGAPDPNPFDNEISDLQTMVRLHS